MKAEKQKILICVEGDRTEAVLVERLFTIYQLAGLYEIVTYKTNIFHLYQNMFRGRDPEDMDLLLVLKEHEQNSEKKKLFDNKYSDILLIFDMEPQDPLFSPIKLLEMQAYFSESDGNGKLYINYPTVESFYHMATIPDVNYLNRYISLSEIIARQYKSKVHRESFNSDYRKYATDKASYNIIIKQNIQKAWFIIGSEKGESAQNQYPPLYRILEQQLNILQSESRIWVLCTCLSFITEYNPLLIE
jgi:hypothetical protein